MFLHPSLQHALLAPQSPPPGLVGHEQRLLTQTSLPEHFWWEHSHSATPLHPVAPAPHWLGFVHPQTV